MGAGIEADITCVKPLNIIGKYVGILPNFESKNSTYIYPIFLIIIAICNSLWAFWGKFLFATKALKPTVSFLDISVDIATAISNICAIFSICILKRKKIELLYKKIVKIDEELKNVEFTSKCSILYFKMEILFAYILFLLYCLFNGYVWINTLGLSIYKYYGARDFQNLHSLTLGMILRHYALHIRYKCMIHNHLLRNIFVSVKTDNIILSSNTLKRQWKNNSWEISRIRQLFTSLVSLLQSYNDIFGINFITMYSCIVLNLLAAINMSFVYGFNANTINGNKFGNELIILSVVWGTIPFVIGFGIFSACHKGTSEFKKTTQICYLLIQEVNLSNTMKEELEKFASQSSNACVNFSAAGFFDVNYGILFGLLGSISSYLIVLFQFN